MGWGLGERSFFKKIFKNIPSIDSFILNLYDNYDDDI
jgi:hypothetical protein